MQCSTYSTHWWVMTDCLFYRLSSMYYFMYNVNKLAGPLLPKTYSPTFYPQIKFAATLFSSTTPVEKTDLKCSMWKPKVLVVVFSENRFEIYLQHSNRYKQTSKCPGVLRWYLFNWNCFNYSCRANKSCFNSICVF